MGFKNEVVWKKNDQKKELVIFKCVLIDFVGDGLRLIYYEFKCIYFFFFWIGIIGWSYFEIWIGVIQIVVSVFIKVYFVIVIQEFFFVV